MRFAVMGLVVGAMPAIAECPGNVSGLAGVELSRIEPFFANVYRHGPEGLTEARVMERDGAEEEVSTIYRHALAPGQQISAKGTLVLDYAANPDELERLDETKTWSSDVVLKIDGRAVLSGRAEKRFVGTETMTVGTCRTEVWLVEDRLDLGGGDGSYLLLSYAPDLGLVLRSVTMSADGSALQGVEFDRLRALDD